MAQDTPPTVEGTDAAVRTGRLDSWKEIAAHLRRDVTTVRRWEKREGLPVHRHLHERRDSVYSYTAEIDEWWEGRRNGLAGNGVLEQVKSGNGAERAASTLAHGVRPPRFVSLPWALAATFFATTVILAGLFIVRDAANPEGAAPELRFAVFPPEGTSFGSVSVSPDGRQLAFTALPLSSTGGRPLLWVRPLDSLSAQALPETENAAFPFWSPNGESLGFFADGRLWTIDLRGGSPRAVADAPRGRGGTWNRQGIIVFAPDREGVLHRVSATGGASAPVSALADEERGHVWPEFLPDGVHFMYLADTHLPSLERHTVFVGSLDEVARQPLMPLVASSVTHANGYLFFSRRRQLMAQPFDPFRFTLGDEGFTLVDRVHEQRGFDHKADFSVSASGVFAYRGMQSPATRLVWRDRANALSPLVSAPAEHYEPVLSPDETRVAIAVFDPTPSSRFGYGVAGVRSDIWIVDRATGSASPFSSTPWAEWAPLWSPDNRTIVFSSYRTGKLELYQKSAVGEGFEELLVPSQGSQPVAQSWSPDGKFLLYSAFNSTTHLDLWLLPMSGDRKPRPLLQTGFSEQQGQISPDGRWLAYSSNQSGHEEVYVRSFPDLAGPWQISTNGGGDPRWRRDGTELYYVAEDRQLMSVEVTLGARFAHGPAVPLFDTGMPPHWYEARNLYDVSRDGRFLFMKPVEDDRSPWTVVVNPAEASWPRWPAAAR
ncbi:MAG: hypothetical protein ACT4QD_00595 [Acidobacteriota bacterium]